MVRGSHGGWSLDGKWRRALALSTMVLAAVTSRTTMDELHTSLSISNNSQIPPTAAAVAGTTSSTGLTIMLLGRPRFGIDLAAVEVVSVLGQSARWSFIF
jgi:hypothetical protein